MLRRFRSIAAAYLLPIPGHVIGVSQRHKRGSGVRRFGAKETQPLQTGMK